MMKNEKDNSDDSPVGVKCLGTSHAISEVDMPDMEAVETLFIKQRDDIATLHGIQPEQVHMVGIKVAFIVDLKMGDGIGTVIVSMRENYTNEIMEKILKSGGVF